MQIEHPLRAAFDLLVRKAPIDAQIVVTRRCNLSCGYCSEYDAHSPEVPFETLSPRLDAIHRLRSANIALLGGEPLLHSRIDDVVRYAARRAQVSMTTNGFLLDKSMIARLGDAGLANLQISLDAVGTDRTGYIQKTLRALRPKLDRLAEHARFEVHVTTVLCAETVAEFDELLRQLDAYPFRVSVNLVHDDRGQVLVQGPAFEQTWERFFKSGRSFSYIEHEYGRKLLAGQRPSWKCGAGARFLYIGEDGTVELCSAQRGRIGKQITDYTTADLDAHRDKRKGCEEGCSVLCAYRDSLIDDDPKALGRALLRGLRAGAFRTGRRRPRSLAPGKLSPTRRRLPIARE